MSATEKSIEQDIQSKGLDAPRITPEHIDSLIEVDGTDFHQFEGVTTIVCCITLKNGYTVTGESACASPENFDPQIGRDIAFKNARQKIWSLEGYLLKEKLYQNDLMNARNKAL